jgi:hypothetical protein
VIESERERERQIWGKGEEKGRNKWEKGKKKVWEREK